jgi:predicted ester cyclase
MAVTDMDLAVGSTASGPSIEQIQSKQRRGNATGVGLAALLQEDSMEKSLLRIIGVTSLVTLFACSGTDESVTARMTQGEEPEPLTEVAEGTSGTVPVAEQLLIIEDRLDATNTRDWDRWEALHTANAIRTAPELEAPLRGATAMRAAIEALSVAFPDYHLELEQSIAQGDWLAVRLHTTGTMTGPLALSDGTSVPATGRTIEQEWSALVRFEGDRIAEFHEFYDQLTLMVQLGLVSP